MKDGLKEILIKHNALNKNIDYIFDKGQDLYQDLFEYYADEMPYGVQKCRTGDPDEWIFEKLDESGLMKN